jgi:peptidase M28-like protein
MRFFWLAPILVSGSLAAQGPDFSGRAVESITAEDVMRRIALIADDSMLGRANPSTGLELTAGYVASEFRRLGLSPAGENNGYMQRFGLSRWVIDTEISTVELSTKLQRASVRVGVDARYLDGRIPAAPLVGRGVVISGLRARAADLGDRFVMVAIDYSRPLPPSLTREVLDLAAAGPKAVFLISNRDSATFAERLRTGGLPRYARDSDPSDTLAPILEVHERSVGPVLAAAGIDPTRLRRLPPAKPRMVADLTVELRLGRKILSRGQVPNVIGKLEGSDPVLRQEYLVYSAHIDHIGVSPGQPDSINNGADDNASGVAGLLELAEAFSQPGARPKRSLLFLAPSAEEPGLLGSAHFTEHPTVPLQSMVADINMDLIGRNWPDSVIAVGLEQSDLGETLRKVAATHPELQMTPIRDRWPEERIFYRSDHYNFARKGVPILFFTSGTHPDYHRPSDEPGRINGEKESRMVRLLFHLGSTIANQPLRPRWTAESYRQIVERQSQP